MNIRKAGILVLALLMLLPAPALASTLTVDVKDTTVEISDMLYGLSMEDINYAADGGLYAELLQNRSFEYEDILNPRESAHYTGWALNMTESASSTVALGYENPLHENNPAYMQVYAAKGQYRFANLGYQSTSAAGGIPVKRDQTYRGYVWMRNAGDFEGEVEIVLARRGGSSIAKAQRFTLTNEWQKYEFSFIANQTENAILCFTVYGTGHVDVDMASLMPADAFGAEWPGGGLREDLVKAMKRLNPSFLYFPGSSAAEGSDYSNWKDTVGPVETRKETMNAGGYTQSWGLGYYEYFMLAEALRAEPIPVVHSGVLNQTEGKNAESLSLIDTLDYAQDIVDLIEFANGDVTTKWGALRAEMGHPEPFNLKYLAIGNENWNMVYWTHFDLIYSDVKAKYPDITIISSAGAQAEGTILNASWATVRDRYPQNIVNEHTYMSGYWFLNNTKRYDSYARDIKVFVGEYAVHEAVSSNGRRPNSLYSAICEAAYLTGLERNGDVVAMASYAPLLAREGLQQWTPNLIWFNAGDVMLTPNYHVQQMFANNLGEWVVKSYFTGFNQDIYHVVTRTDDVMYIKVVNAGNVEEEMNLDLTGVVDEDVCKTTLTGEKNDTNTFGTKNRLEPMDDYFRIEGGYTTIILPPYSVTVMTFNLDKN